MSDRESAPETETVTLTVNGHEISAPKGQLVIDAADRCGVYIPRFCYHPRMRPVGMCRMCIVDIDTGRGPTLQPACMIPVADGMQVDSESEATRKAQDGVLEFLLVNHPLDCPVCDKGGECPLQDQAYAYGPGESRFVEEKRHFEKPVPISDLVLLDRERCILCDRCTRFAAEVAGDPLIHFMERGGLTEVNTFPDHPFASYFSGNTVQICPVGALTAAPFRFRARPWDLEHVESTCTACSVGCRMVIQSSRNRVLRYGGVDVDAVNWGWLCDKGRFGFEAINAEDRLGEPLVRKEGELIGVSWAEAISVATEAFRQSRDRGPSSVGVIGGARLTNEAAYAWAKLAKGVIGTDNVDCQLGDGLPADVVAGLPRATIDDVCRPGGTVVVLAPDLKEELPVLFLRVRHAVVSDGARVVELASMATSLTPLAERSVRYRPGEAHVAMRELIDGGALGGDGPLTCILGRPSLAESPAGIVAAAALLLEAHPDIRFLSALRRANVHGAIDMGLAPGLLPGRVALDDAGRAWFADAWDTVPTERGRDTAGILAAAAEGRIRTLVLLGADPLRDFPDQDLARRGLTGAHTVVAVDCFVNESAARHADVVLPVSSYAETRGSTTNLEGRVSLLDRKVTPPGTARDDWVLATDLAYGLGADLRLESVEDLWAEIERVAPAHTGITRHVLQLPAARDGVVVPMAPGTFGDADGTPVSIEGKVIPDAPDDVPETAPEDVSDTPAEVSAAPAAGDDAGTETDEPAQAAAGDAGSTRPSPLTFTRLEEPAPSPAPDSYSLRLVVTRKLYDRGTLVAHAPSLAGLAPGSVLRLNPADADRVGAADGATVKVSSARGSATMPVARDGAVPQGVAALVVNQPGADPAPLVDAAAPVTEIRVEFAMNALGLVLAAGDPLFVDGLDAGVVAIVVLKVFVVFAMLLVATMLMVWFERKLIGDMQNRLGPNRAGPFGVLQTLADGIKLFFKEDLLPDRADKRVFRLAPYLSVVPAFLTFSVVPIGGAFIERGEGSEGTVRLFGHDTFLQLADPPVGILLVLAMSSIAVYGVMLAGWSSGSKYPLLGSVRASAQMVSYEAALGLSVAAVVLVTGSLSTHDIVLTQAGDGRGLLPNWNLITTGFVPFVIFLIAGTAELNRPPFDLVEAEQELVGGFNTEYSSIRFALFFLAEFMNTVTMSAVIVTLFLGGPSGPLVAGPDWIWPLFWFFLKLLVFLYVFVWFRATLPRFRYDQLMDLGWKLLIPLALAWLLLLSAIRVGDDEGWNTLVVTAVAFVVIVAAAGLLRMAMRTRRVAEPTRGSPETWATSTASS